MTVAFFYSTVALCKLLQHGLNTDDKRLQDIVVKGEEIYNPEDGIRTRSKSAKSKSPKDLGCMTAWLLYIYIQIYSSDIVSCVNMILYHNDYILEWLFLLLCFFTDPERWTNIPLLVKVFKLIINELSTVVEANASRANAADWSQGEYNQTTPPVWFIQLQGFSVEWYSEGIHGMGKTWIQLALSANMFNNRVGLYRIIFFYFTSVLRTMLTSYCWIFTSPAYPLI